MIMIAGNLRPAEDGGTARAPHRGLGLPGVQRRHACASPRAIPPSIPQVDERMLSDDSDLVRMRDGVRRLRELCRHPEVQAISTPRRVRLDRPLDRRAVRPAALDDWMFAECSDAQHASGTCRMGAADDPRSVVDPDCRVIGCHRPARDRRLGHADRGARQHPSHDGDDRREDGRPAPAPSGAQVKGGSDGQRPHRGAARAAPTCPTWPGSPSLPRSRSSNPSCRSSIRTIICGTAPDSATCCHELLADTGSGHNIVGTVFVECRSMYRADGPAELRPRRRDRVRQRRRGDERQRHLRQDPRLRRHRRPCRPDARAPR